MLTFRWRSTVVAAALVLAAMWTAPIADAGVVYATDFEPPTFVPGLLQGQDGWFAYVNKSIAAATVSAQQPHGGTQGVRIDGSLMEQPFPGVFGGYYLRDMNYDPIGTNIFLPRRKLRL
jgi:hypothetical protein